MENLFHDKTDEELLNLHKQMVAFINTGKHLNSENEFAQEVIAIQTVKDSYDWSDIGFELEIEIANRWEPMIGMKNNQKGEF